MDSKNEARPAVESKRATDPKINNSLSRAVKCGMARQRRDEWESGMRLLPIPFLAMLAVYLFVQIANGGFSC